MTATKAGIGFEISFRSEQEAERFQERFASLLPAYGELTHHSLPMHHSPLVLTIA